MALPRWDARATGREAVRAGRAYDAVPDGRGAVMRGAADDARSARVSAAVTPHAPRCGAPAAAAAGSFVR
eukprot:7362748-Lingulodinium_polyedra.AAC.1